MQSEPAAMTTAALTPGQWLPTALGGLLTILLAGGALAQDADIRLRTTEVVPGMYMLDGADGAFAGGNMLLMPGEDGVILIDGGLEIIESALLEALTELTGEPVDFLLNTHVHGDHTGNNAIVHEQGATIVGHVNIRQRLADDAAGSAALPQITYEEGITLHLNGFTTEVMFVSSAHTDGDSIVYFPGVNVIHAGDTVFNGLFPFIDFENGGSVEGYLAAHQKILALADDDTVIVPGHGPIGDAQDVQALHDLIADCLERIRPLKISGLTEDEVVARNPLADYDAEWNWEFITTERMTRQMYQSL